jgi:predicted acylesterase/phospholipase RssA
VGKSSERNGPIGGIDPFGERVEREGTHGRVADGQDQIQEGLDWCVALFRNARFDCSFRKHISRMADKPLQFRANQLKSHDALRTRTARDADSLAFECGNANAHAPFCRWGRFSSIYDLSPMRDRLKELIDFGRLNAGSVRLSIAATNLETGETVIFESQREPIRMEHLLASCGFIPEFAPVKIGGKLLGDGGLSANAPVEAVLFEPVETLFVLDCFARDGIYSSDLETALARKIDLRKSDPPRARTANARSCASWPCQRSEHILSQLPS